MLSQIVLRRQIVLKKFQMYFLKSTLSYTVYNSVPTDTHELDGFHNTISNDVIPSSNISITPAIIKHCLKRLKLGKGEEVCVRSFDT